jgi:hypothetical protein
MQTCPTHQVSVENLPDVKGYASSDAFVKHPTVEGLFKMYVVPDAPDGHACCSESLIVGVYSVGRLDDVLIHSSGEKTVPAPMEILIGSSPLLSGVCMFGRGRSQTGVLVEPRPEYAIDITDDVLVAEFRNKIWCVAWVFLLRRRRTRSSSPPFQQAGCRGSQQGGARVQPDLQRDDLGDEQGETDVAHWKGDGDEEGNDEVVRIRDRCTVSVESHSRPSLWSWNPT